MNFGMAVSRHPSHAAADELVMDQAREINCHCMLPLGSQPAEGGSQERAT
jgi:hypothetical protein